jgi:hypothetical protein
MMANAHAPAETAAGRCNGIAHERHRRGMHDEQRHHRSKSTVIGEALCEDVQHALWGRGHR